MNKWQSTMQPLSMQSIEQLKSDQLSYRYITAVYSSEAMKIFTILLCNPIKRKKAEQSIQMQLLAMQSIPMQSDVQAVKQCKQMSYLSNCNQLYKQCKCAYNPSIQSLENQ